MRPFENFLFYFQGTVRPEETKRKKSYGLESADQYLSFAISPYKELKNVLKEEFSLFLSQKGSYQEIEIPQIFLYTIFETSDYIKQYYKAYNILN